MSKEILRRSCRIVTKLVVEKMIRNLENKKKHKRKGRIWVKKWISRRENLGSQGLSRVLASEDAESFRNHLRMSETSFDFLLQRVTPYIEKKDTRMRDALSAKLKLQITLRFLATGDSFASLQYLYHVPKCTISKFLPEVCEAIYNSLQDYIKVPNTQEEWKKIIQGFSTRWDFPHCGGALDGKHIVLKYPFHSGSDFYNYKGSCSIILLALVDDQYCFEYIDVGTNRRASNGGVYAKSTVRSALENNTLNIPSNTVFIADDAFPLKEYLLKPYSHHGALTLKEKIFNYRLSRAGRIAENAFGLLVSRFGVFEKPIALCPEKADSIIKAACALHNWLQKTTTTYISRGCVDEEDFENGTILNGSWRQEIGGAALPDMTLTNDSRNYTRAAADVRNQLSDWFMGDGAISWQMNMIHN